MLKETIKYTDFNGVEREEPFFFNLTRAELTEMELSKSGGLAASIKKILDTQDTPSLIKIFKEIILKSYGEKSEDGKRFMKVDKNGVPLSIAFSETEAYSVLFTKLASDDSAAVRFITGIIPNDIDLSQSEELKNNPNLAKLLNA